MMKCEICGKDTKPYLTRCEEHHVCDTCGTKENLIVSSGLFCKRCLDDKIQEQIKNFHGDTSFQNDITCPHCGCVYHDSWEYTQNGTEQCIHCGNTFELEIHYTVEYSTSKNTGE